MAVADITLPPGVTERNGRYYRTITKRGRDEVGVYDEPEEREVLVATGTDVRSITADREEAARKGLDFYDPRVATDPATGNVVRDHITGEPVVIGWLDRGRKRHDEWPWNLGSDEFRNNRVYITEGDETPDAAFTRAAAQLHDAAFEGHRKERSKGESNAS